MVAILKKTRKNDVAFRLKNDLKITSFVILCPNKTETYSRCATTMAHRLIISYPLYQDVQF